MSVDKLISIIIPCYNEEERLPKRFDKAYKFINNYLGNFEIILVNDGSRDKTLEILKALAKEYKNVIAVSYTVNQGKGYAIAQGMKKAKGDIVGYMDADFAIPLDQLSIFIEYINQGYEVVIGDRSQIESKVINKPNVFRRFIGKSLGIFNKYLLDLNGIIDTQCGFKFFKKEQGKKLFKDLFIKRWLFDIEVLIKSKRSNYKIRQVPIRWEEVEGSKVNLVGDIFPVGKDLIKLYYLFFSAKILLAILFFLIILILLPFWFQPKSLVLRSGDFSDQIWPAYLLMKQSVFKYGEIPLWNPYLFSGIPEISNPASPIIYPPNYLIFILPLDHAILVLILVHVLVAGYFLFKLGKDVLKWSTAATLLLVFGIVFSPFLWSKFAVGHLVIGFAMLLLPGILYFGSKFYLTGSKRYLLGVSAFLSGIYLNHPAMWYYIVLFGVIICFFIAFKDRKIKQTFYLVLGYIFSLILILPIFILQLQAGPLITRSSLTINDLSIPIWSISRFLESLIVPSNFTGEVESEVWLYPSLGLLALSIIGFIKSSRFYKGLSLGLILLIVLITLGSRTPIFNLLVTYVPGFSYLRVSTRVWFLMIFVLSILGAWGIEKVSFLKKYVVILVLLELVSFSLLRMWYIPPIMITESSNKFVNFLNQDKNYRYYCTSRCLSAMYTLPKDIKTADGYHLLILKNYQKVLSNAGGFEETNYTGNIPAYEVANAQPNAELLGKFAIKWVISKNRLIDTNFKQIYQEGEYILYENTLVQPRLRFEKIPTNTINLLSESPNRINVSTSGLRDTFVLADSFYPGWYVYIDGKKAEMKLYDGWARSVNVPEGDHIIEFVFRPFDNLISL